MSSRTTKKAVVAKYNQTACTGCGKKFSQLRRNKSKGNNNNTAITKSLTSIVGQSKHPAASQDRKSNSKPDVVVCKRCQFATYCSVECQHKHYQTHNLICPPRIKGVPIPPNDSPRTKLTYPIKAASINEDVLIHTTNDTKNVQNDAFEFTGVYSLAVKPDRYCKVRLDRDSGKTRKLEMHIRSRIRKLPLPFNFAPYLVSKHKNQQLALQQNNGGKYSWFMNHDNLTHHKNNQEWYLSEQTNQMPLIRDEMYWDDPNAWLTMCISVSDIYGNWNIMKIDKHEKHYTDGSISIAITPLWVVYEILDMDCYDIPRPMPKALDFQAWNKPFVLHIDHRTCLLPLNFLDSFMGVYQPIDGELSNGYPVWERRYDLTAELVQTMNGAASAHLKDEGLRLWPRKDGRKFQLCVSKGVGSSSLHTRTNMLTLKSEQQVCLETSRISSEQEALLVDPVMFSKIPHESFVTWQASYFGRSVQVHVAFTPKDSFVMAIDKMQQQYELALVHAAGRNLALEVGLNCSIIPPPSIKNVDSCKWSAKGALEFLFDVKGAKKSCPWGIFDEQSVSSCILRQAHTSMGVSAWIEGNNMFLFKYFLEKHRDHDMNAILDRYLDEQFLDYLFGTTELSDDGLWSSIEEGRLPHILKCAFSSRNCSDWLERNKQQLMNLFIKSEYLDCVESLLVYDSNGSAMLDFLFGIKSGGSTALWTTLGEGKSSGILERVASTNSFAWFKINQIPLLQFFIKSRRFKDMEVLLSECLDEVTLCFLFGIETNEHSPPWSDLPKCLSKSILDNILWVENNNGDKKQSSREAALWIKKKSSKLLDLFLNNKRYGDLSVLIGVGIPLSVGALLSVTSIQKQIVSEITNSIFISETCTIQMQADEDFDRIINGLPDAEKIGEETRSAIVFKIKSIKATRSLALLASFVRADCHARPKKSFMSCAQARAGKRTVDATLNTLFGGSDTEYSPWSLLDESASSPLFKACLSSPESLRWFECNASQVLVVLCSRKIRQEDVKMLLGIGVTVTAKAAAVLFSNLEKGKGNQFNNIVAKLLCSKCELLMQSKNDYKLLTSAISDTVSKGAKKDITAMLKKASAELQKPKRQNSHSNNNNSNIAELVVTRESQPEVDESKKEDAQPAKNATQINFDADKKIKNALEWYNKELEKIVDEVPLFREDNRDVIDAGGKWKDLNGGESEDTVVSGKAWGQKCRPSLTSSEQIASALDSCESEDALMDIEASIDLLRWDSNSEWTIDITEQAHKWISKHIKRDRSLVEHVFRRLAILSTGRWPYSLQKRLKTRSTNKRINLYETKLDSASRIIWEVALAFSPRRSSLEQNYVEQVVRVWDIVLDHDNLSRAINKTIERIEKSHLRGEQCALYTEIDKTLNNKSSSVQGKLSANIPKVFPMSSELVCTESMKQQPPKGKSRHFTPATDDPKQYTLLKFYELNSGAIKMLLDGQTEMDLPFTPGPKEHEIIHYQSEPQRSILLMGRSGTGKTTCLVFRMWAQYASYADAEKVNDAPRPRQLFLTKNDVLCREVKRSFKNMGLAWRKRKIVNEEDCNVVSSDNDPKFLTSREWLTLLDQELPGHSFFTLLELEQRKDEQKHLMDTVTKEVEDLLLDETSVKETLAIIRQEMTYETFRKLWKKIRSGSTSSLDCTIVWREIKSFIKGSVAALRIGEDRTNNRFLSLEGYLALPRKQSRMDEIQRREVYDLYLNYEKVKKEGRYYDECDLVYSIASRISLIDQTSFDQVGELGVLPIDSLFLDEAQDFTMAELYILAKLCRDPNNLFLAGDTAQSIALGVDFRFTDVRQIFYNSFGGIEPRLLQLSHNYRSHAGVLRLAASVVELLYHFFGNSLDKLPPDLGLFSGPKPVIMEVANGGDLVLMLEGAKRETSRIEFGAHQVVIVKSEEAKKNLPDEFGIDMDWVMTVQESKGLEFDDVLIYDFFSDSPAGDLWRVVQNYSEDDIAAYYADATVAASGVQKYDWESPLLTETRPLDFDESKHKILETELKMLYTAITRARVNVFIAETNTEVSRPMFNYFQRRAVVDILDKENKEGPVRVFGSESTQEEWRKRGEYYLKNSEDNSRPKGCLRLAAKCLEKGGDLKRRDFALAYLAFIEIDEEESKKKRGKQSLEARKKLLDITEQLLEARDVEFLNKAALCLLRTGQYDESCAKMFDLFARIQFSQRMHDDKCTALPLRPSQHEKKYFSFAGAFFEKKGLLFDSLRSYACGGAYDKMTLLLTSNIKRLQNGKALKQLQDLCLFRGEVKDPVASFQKDFDESSEGTSTLVEAVKRVGQIGCRTLYKQDADGFSVALSLIPSRNDRVILLNSIVTNSDSELAKKTWARHHLFLSQDAGDQIAIDLTNLLVTELEHENKYEESAEILSDRGFLLEAATRYNNLARLEEKEDKSQSLIAKAIALRVRWVELMMLCEDLEEQKDKLLSTVTIDETQMEVTAVDVKCASLISKACLQKKGSITNLLDRLSSCNESVIWQYHCLKLMMKSIRTEQLLDNIPGQTVYERFKFVNEMAYNIKHLALLLRRKELRTAEENILVSGVDGYFNLQPKRLDHTILTTNPLVNLRLREVLHEEKIDPPLAFGGNSLFGREGFSQLLDRNKIHLIISRFLLKKVAELLMILDEMIALHIKKVRPCLSFRSTGFCERGGHCQYLHSLSATDLCEYVDCLQAHIKCGQEMASLYRADTNLDSMTGKAWATIRKSIKGNNQEIVIESLFDILCRESHVLIRPHNADGIGLNSSEVDKEIILEPHTLAVLKKYSTKKFASLSEQAKRNNIYPVILHWRLLNLAVGTTVASQELHNEISRVERSKYSQNDLRRGKTRYFVNVERREIYPRLWLWAVESSEDEFITSVEIVERVIQMSGKVGIMRLRKLDCIALLKVNSVALFGALSLRYSEVTSPPLFIPETWQKTLLSGLSGCSKLIGFGKPLTQSLLSTCSKDFDTIFEKVVLHLEHTAGIIMKTKLLGAPLDKNEDIERMVDVLSLCTFLVCNAVIFSSRGQDITVAEYKHFRELPSLPLAGNIKKLIAEMRCLFNQNHFPPQFSIEETPRTCRDLALLNDRILELAGDRFIQCQLKQETEHDVKIQHFEETNEIMVLLSKVPFDESHERFDSSVGSSFLEKVNNFDAIYNADEHGRKSEEMNARRTIAQFIESKIHRLDDDEDAIILYRRWKLVMRVFIRRLKRRLSKKLANRRDEPKLVNLNSDNGQSIAHTCVFEQIINTLQNRHIVAMRREGVMSVFNNAVVDGIECTYCCMAHNGMAQSERFGQWNYEGRRVIYPMFVQHFNMIRFGNEIAYPPIYFNHIQSSQHNDHVVQYMRQLHDFATVFARLELSRELLDQVIRASTIEGEKADMMSSWYVNTCEEARGHFMHLHHALTSIELVAYNWSLQPSAANYQQLHGVMQQFLGTPQNVESFIEQKRCEETDMKKEQLGKESNSYLNEDTINSTIVELARGSYLNPEAHDFVPQS